MEQPRPHTAEEIAALPEGGSFSVREELRNGQMVRIPVAPDLVLFWSDDTDPLGYFDDNGVYWQLIRYADGHWARMRRG